MYCVAFSPAVSEGHGVVASLADHSTVEGVLDLLLALFHPLAVGADLGAGIGEGLEDFVEDDLLFLLVFFAVDEDEK